MAIAARRFRFVRKAARAQWYLGIRYYAPMLLLAIGYGLLAQTRMAWILSALCTSLFIWQFWKERQREARFWNSRRDLVVWLDDGRLWASRPGLEHPEFEELDEVHAVDAVVERGEVVRLLVDDRDGKRTIYAGFDDMEAFAAAFRSNTPKARFRRVRFGFPMTLKEI